MSAWCNTTFVVLICYSTWLKKDTLDPDREAGPLTFSEISCRLAASIDRKVASYYYRQKKEEERSHHRME